MKNVLVTGAGALLGQGILRCLKFSDNQYRIITADPDYRAQGHCLGHHAYVIPLANNPSYINKVEELIDKEKIDVVLVGTDIELPLFAKHKERLEKNFPVKIIVSNENVIKIANDKWLTAEFLKANNYPYPLSALTSDEKQIEFLISNCSFPFIAKPVDGARSKGIVIIHNRRELENICSFENNLVVQELLSDNNGEYTTGCLVLKNKCKAIVSLKRDLRDGNTYRAYRQGENIHDKIIGEIAEKLGVYGPVNFQYRVKNGEPVIFEINGRFSGTTPLRYMFGFNEVESLLNEIFEIEEIKQPILRNGTVFRVFSDIFVENNQLNDLVEKNTFSNYKCEYFPFYQ